MKKKESNLVDLTLCERKSFQEFPLKFHDFLLAKKIFLKA